LRFPALAIRASQANIPTAELITFSVETAIGMRLWVQGWVMASKVTVRADADEIEAMRRHCADSLKAGALGFTTSRTWAISTR
jgi:hypothetical protein